MVVRALVAFLLPHRWKGQLAAAKRLLDSPPESANGVGEKIDAWLESPGWEVRNAAVKLIARVRDEARYGRLLGKLADRDEAGIVRRNAAEAIAQIGLRTEAARSVLLEAMSDPYWEVRAEAIHALAALFPASDDLERRLLDGLYGPPKSRRRHIREENFEVRMAIAQAMGCLGVSELAFDALADLAQDDSWPVRSQVAVAMAHFATRHPSFLARARRELLAIDRQSEGSVPYFVHRDIVGRAMVAVRDAGAEPRTDFTDLYLNPKAGWNHIRR